MKKLIFLIPFLTFSLLAYAQDEDELDSLAFSDSPHRPFLLSILQAPVLEGMSTPRLIVPNESILCYDKTITFKTNGEGFQVQGCLFIDTEDGFMAFIPPKYDRNPECVIKDQEEDFNLTVLGLAGNVFNYANYRKDGVLQHVVTTGNSETFLQTYTSSNEAASLQRTLETKDFLDGKIKAHVYERADRDEKWYLFGKEFPPEILFSPKKYLGNFGIGYQHTEKGLYLIMQVTGTNYEAEITDIQSEMNCFDSRPFRQMETEFFEHALESIDRNREKLDRKAESASGDDYCGSIKARNIQYKRELLAKQESQLKQSHQGSVQQNTSGIQGMSQAMANYEDVMQQQIYETELLICQQEKILTFPANARSPETVQRVRTKIACLEQQKAKEIQTKQKMRELEEQSPNDPMQTTKKQRLLMEVIQQACK